MAVRRQVREQAVIALLSAASIAGRVVMEPIPGFQPTTVIVMVTTMALGLRQGVLVAIISTWISNLQLGHGIWTFFQMLSWSAVAFVSFYYGKTKWSRNLLVSAAAAGLLGIIYGMVVSLNGLLFTRRIIAYYLAGLSHDLTHAAGNVAMYVAFGDRLGKLLRKYSEAYFGQK
ncbi:MAG TPA: hypothetical protein GX739_02020 [Firmicutes bacterium]|nr:hypothetical protein [Bacillota bacterium]